MAIEHPKDADLAAGIVLTEVIPLMSKYKTPTATPTQDMSPGVPINVQGAFTCYVHPVLHHYTLCALNWFTNPCPMMC